MNNKKIIMIRENLDNIPNYKLPQGYSFRFFTPGDEHNWATIEYLAGEFNSKEKALQRFNQEFKHKQNLLETRCLFLLNDQNDPIGTIMAWEEGRIHWVAIIPEYQGKGLSKPLLSKALEILRTYYTTAYLTTQSSNKIAIQLYLNFNFKLLSHQNNYII